MGKRLSFTDREIGYLVKGLEYLQNEARLDYPVIKAGRTAYQDIIDKLQPPTKEAQN